MKPKVYIETTIPSYLTASPSRDLVKAARQQITQEWWESQREAFDLYISEVVLDEARAGDPAAAARRLERIQYLLLLELNPQAIALAQDFIQQGPLPQKATLDALHIALAVVSGMDYLLTWNCTHIANATIRNIIEEMCRSRGYEPPVICTPDELMSTES